MMHDPDPARALNAWAAHRAAGLCRVHRGHGGTLLNFDAQVATIVCADGRAYDLRFPYRFVPNDSLLPRG